MDMNLERLLKQHNQLEALGPRILEINPTHPLIKKLANLARKENIEKSLFNDVAHLLVDQARIVEGEPVREPKAFVDRLSKLMVESISD